MRAIEESRLRAPRHQSPATKHSQLRVFPELEKCYGSYVEGTAPPRWGDHVKLDRWAKGRGVSGSPEPAWGKELSKSPPHQQGRSTPGMQNYGRLLDPFGQSPPCGAIREGTPSLDDGRGETGRCDTSSATTETCQSRLLSRTTRSLARRTGSGCLPGLPHTNASHLPSLLRAPPESAGLDKPAQCQDLRFDWPLRQPVRRGGH
jgi:hypothetical protein